MRWIIARLKEPSTKAALGVLATAAAAAFPQYQPVLLAVATVLSGTAVATKG